MCGTTFRTFLNLTVVILVLLNIATCSPYDNIHTLDPSSLLNNNEYDAMENSPPYISDMSTGNDVIPENKRSAGLSVNGGLRSLVEMLYSQERRRRHEERTGMQNALLKLGKRGWSTPMKLDQLQKRPDPGMYHTTGISRRGSQQLSVSGPLSALASMLDAETLRRKHYTTKHSNRMRLLQLGKRGGQLDVEYGGKTDDSENDDSYEKEFV